MKLLISEEQYRKLFEARMEGFRLDYLRSAKSLKERVKYCNEMLGAPIGKGSSRLVYQIDDETVLKLAYNKKGIAQNSEEIKIASEGFIGCVPKIYNGSDEDNGLWVITQYVLPAKKEDFKNVLGMDFNDICNFARYTDRRHDRRFGDAIMRNADNAVRCLYNRYENNEEVIEIFNDINELKASYDQMAVDFGGIRNWGLTRENGKEKLVILDTGFSEEVYNQFYRRM